MNEKMSVFSSVDMDEISGMQAKLERHGITSEIEKETVRYDDNSIAGYDVYQLVVDIADYENNMHFITSVVDEHFEVSEEEQKQYDAGIKEVDSISSCFWAALFSFLLPALFIDIKKILWLLPRKAFFALGNLIFTIGVVGFFIVIVRDTVSDYQFFAVFYAVLNLIALLTILIIPRIYKTDRKERVTD